MVILLSRVPTCGNMPVVSGIPRMVQTPLELALPNLSAFTTAESPPPKQSLNASPAILGQSPFLLTMNHRKIPQQSSVSASVGLKNASAPDTPRKAPAAPAPRHPSAPTQSIVPSAATAARVQKEKKLPSRAHRNDLAPTLDRAAAFIDNGYTFIGGTLLGSTMLSGVLYGVILDIPIKSSLVGIVMTICASFLPMAVLSAMICISLRTLCQNVADVSRQRSKLHSHISSFLKSEMTSEAFAWALKSDFSGHVTHRPIHPWDYLEHNRVKGLFALKPSQFQGYAKSAQRSLRDMVVLKNLIEVHEGLDATELIRTMSINWAREDLEQSDIQEIVTWLIEQGNTNIIRWVLEHGEDESAARLLTILESSGLPIDETAQSMGYTLARSTHPYRPHPMRVRVAKPRADAKEPEVDAEGELDFASDQTAKRRR